MSDYDIISNKNFWAYDFPEHLIHSLIPYTGIVNCWQKSLISLPGKNSLLLLKGLAHCFGRGFAAASSCSAVSNNRFKKDSGENGQQFKACTILFLKVDLAASEIKFLSTQWHCRYPQCEDLLDSVFVFPLMLYGTIGSPFAQTLRQYKSNSWAHICGASLET